MRKVAWSRKTISVVLLAAVLPISLTVVVFQLFGGETRIAETTTLDPIVWTFQRPNQYVPIRDMLNASHADDGLSATSHMILADYLPRVGSLQYNTLRIRIKMNTTTDQNGYIESVCVVFGEDSQPSTMDWILTRFKLELEEEHFDYNNISLAGKIDGNSMRLDRINNPTSVALSAVAEWGLLTPNNESHQMEISFEVTYYNGSAYNRVVQPFQLNILGAEE